MEDLKAYIETGILELYVLGDVTPAEKLQVEELASKHPAIKAELAEIERSMELYAGENAIEPSEYLRSRVLGSLLTNFGDDNDFPTQTHTERESVVVTRPYKEKEINFYKYAFAACLVLLLASAAALYNLYNRLNDTNTRLNAMQLQNQHFSTTVSAKDSELNLLRDTSFKLIRLKGTEKSSESVMTVAFSPSKQKVVIDMEGLKLPANDQAHQYQLWALVAGKPVDLGVFDATADSSGFKNMKAIASADAFAVTLEPRGGSESPTLSQMVVMGKY
ncbi:anti-sigma factor [Mucilaginibacter sp. P25]|uniref:Anti-sigma factor n=2 Tax=Mucilaginibacter TaxID=423349 RepID=A0AAE6MKB8_9SPHI|nr:MULTISPECIES: anti-sigma factor [Mucilaginibacter]QEM06052.1 anti-sigma factor [Mucilaginibacter rubeus]QEM18633.1 anti-sigma factor [Mucilaginibacter gossypii]QTE44825.1 anti-sigma factor [Mucilaginibacter rubeus]QTE51423.1 anti-sigma factor [Mucilaginibacter rubeus]QTE56509.1 anti-sigma factor [Mucilaginibacter rubeus]